MKQIIFFNERPIYLFSKKSKRLPEFAENEGALYIENGTGKAIKEGFASFAESDHTCMVIAHKDTDKLIRNFERSFVKVDAAGGIVQNENRDLLFIFRNGKWDLPKGKLEKNEDPKEGAAREVEEETGVKNLKLHKKVGKTYHIYLLDGKMNLKTTHWYYFSVPGKPKLIPQKEEGITEIEWIPTRDIRKPMGNTYENIKLILNDYFDEP